MRFSAAILCVLLLAPSLWAQGSSATTAPTAHPQDPAVPAVKCNDDGAPNEDFLAKHARFVEQANKGRIDVVFLGDSITEFWSKNGAEVWAERYAKYDAANFGIGGDRTQHVLWRIENGELDGASKPKVIVLLIGTNNTPTDDPDRIAVGITKIVKTAQAKTGAKVLVLGVFPRGEQGAKKTTMLREKIERINAVISKLDDGKSVRYLDLRDKFLHPDGTLPNSIMPDRLHLSPKGYRIWADSMDPVLKELLRE
jgi:lysophospholipase L1-like esterase